MAEFTSNYNLEKQQGNEFVDIEGINGNFDIIDTEIKTAQDKADRAFQSASNGKEAIKAAITGVDPEVTIPTDATFSQLAAAIGQIKTGVDTEDATVIAEQILAGMTAFVKGVKVTGSMTNRGTVNITPGTANQAILEGYHNGIGVVAGDPNLVSGNIKAGVSIFGKSGKSSVVDTADANVTTGQILTGYTGYANGAKVNGSIPVVNPDYSDQMGTGTVSVGAYTGDGANYAYMYLGLNGKYVNGINYIRHYEPYLIPACIVPGASIMGVPGAASMGRKIQSGAVNSNTSGLTFKNGAGGDHNLFSITVTGLTFKPSYIMAFSNGPSTQGTYIIYKADGIGLNTYNVKIFTGYTYYMGINTSTAGFGEDGTAAYVNSTSFRLPCMSRDTTMYWVAIE